MVTNESGTLEIGEKTVHRLGYGAMRITGEDIIGSPDDEASARDLLNHAIDIGVDFIDTADSYGPGVSERLIREADITDEAVVATKAGLLRNSDGDWLRHGDPDYIRNQALVSRDRLGVDSIDLLQYHAPDESVTYEDSIQAFAELKDEELVDAVGISNVTVDQLETARDHVEVVTVQNHYNVGNREHEAVLEACEEYDIGFMPYFPVGAGNLGAVGNTLDEIADAHDATRYQIALAWLLEHSDVTLPIPGTSSIDHLEENVAAAGVDLTADEYARLS